MVYFIHISIVILYFWLIILKFFIMFCLIYFVLFLFLYSKYIFYFHFSPPCNNAILYHPASTLSSKILHPKLPETTWLFASKRYIIGIFSQKYCGKTAFQKSVQARKKQEKSTMQSYRKIKKVILFPAGLTLAGLGVAFYQNSA